MVIEPVWKQLRCGRGLQNCNQHDNLLPFGLLLLGTLDRSTPVKYLRSMNVWAI